MRTYYDPEDDTCEKTDRYERLLDHADYLRDERIDREMEERETEREATVKPWTERFIEANTTTDDEREDIKADALAILAKCNFMLTGYETQVCEFASGVENGMKSVDMHTFTILRTQFSKEISDHYQA